jgi:hypothetical protein
VSLFASAPSDRAATCLIPCVLDFFGICAEKRLQVEAEANIPNCNDLRVCIDPANVRQRCPYSTA